jgi:hypothetical protein
VPSDSLLSAGAIIAKGSKKNKPFRQERKKGGEGRETKPDTFFEAKTMETLFTKR